MQNFVLLLQDMFYLHNFSETSLYITHFMWKWSHFPLSTNFNYTLLCVDNDMKWCWLLLLNNFNCRYWRNIREITKPFYHLKSSLVTWRTLSIWLYRVYRVRTFINEEKCCNEVHPMENIIIVLNKWSSISKIKHYIK